MAEAGTGVGRTGRAKLTKDVVDRTPPDRTGSPDGRIVWDTELKGFRLRVRPTGRKTYELMYRDIHGRKRLLILGEHGRDLTADQARKKAIIERGKVAGGENPQQVKRERRQALTIGDLITLYLDNGPADKPEKRDSSWATDRANLERHVRPLLGNKIAAELRPEDISQWQAQVAAGKSAFSGKSDKLRGRINVQGGTGAAARSVRTFSAMLAWSHRRKFIDGNPAQHVAKLKDSRRDRFLSDEEAGRLWRAVVELQAEGAITDLQATAFRLLMLTGGRRNEILELRWAEVDLSRRALILPPHRNKAGGRPKSIPLADAAVEELKRVVRTGEYLFPAASGDGPMTPPKRAWAKVASRAELPGVTFHILRHTLASFAVADGASLYIVGKALGHAKPETTQRYAHLRDDAAAEVTEAAGARYTRPKEPPPVAPMGRTRAFGHPSVAGMVRWLREAEQEGAPLSDEQMLDLLANDPDAAEIRVKLQHFAARLGLCSDDSAVGVSPSESGSGKQL